jgi:uncharacterized iron-regulated membrane protein
MSRRFWLLIHRYAGLATAGFLILVGLTGSLLAFLPELDHACSPELYAADTGLPRLDLATLAERAETLAPRARVESLWVGETDTVQVSVSPRTDPATGQPYELGFDQLVLDPFTGAELARRTWGAISEGIVNLMPFVYKLHYALALDEAGLWILGITALIWTLDCFVAFYLTLPARKRTTLTPGRSRKERENGNGRSFWQRWKPAWQIKWTGSAYRINFDLHRAGGLWLWAVLLIFAWSSVYMNLWDTVYTWTTRLVLDYREPWTELPKREKPPEQPRIGWRAAERIARDLMSGAAATHGFSVERPVRFGLDREHGVYVYSVRSSRDIQDRYGQTRVFLDADTGAQRLLLLPSGQYAGNTVTTWLFALHTAKVFGLPYRIFVCVLGLAIVMLSVTGVVIWLRKRRARRLRQRAAVPEMAGIM